MSWPVVRERWPAGDIVLLGILLFFMFILCLFISFLSSCYICFFVYVLFSSVSFLSIEMFPVPFVSFKVSQSSLIKIPDCFLDLLVF